MSKGQSAFKSCKLDTKAAEERAWQDLREKAQATQKGVKTSLPDLKKKERIECITKSQITNDLKSIDDALKEKKLPEGFTLEDFEFRIELFAGFATCDLAEFGDDTHAKKLQDKLLKAAKKLADDHLSDAKEMVVLLKTLYEDDPRYKSCISKINQCNYTLNACEKELKELARPDKEPKKTTDDTREQDKKILTARSQLDSLQSNYSSKGSDEHKQECYKLLRQKVESGEIDYAKVAAALHFMQQTKIQFNAHTKDSYIDSLIEKKISKIPYTTFASAFGFTVEKNCAVRSLKGQFEVCIPKPIFKSKEVEITKVSCSAHITIFWSEGTVEDPDTRTDEQIVTSVSTGLGQCYYPGETRAFAYKWHVSFDGTKSHVWEEGQSGEVDNGYNDTLCDTAKSLLKEEMKRCAVIVKEWRARRWRSVQQQVAYEKALERIPK